MLQTFPREYIFPINLPRSAIALMIGNALPPIFCKIQAQNIAEQLDGIFMADVFDEKNVQKLCVRSKTKIRPQNLLFGNCFVKWDIVITDYKVGTYHVGLILFIPE